MDGWLQALLKAALCDVAAAAALADTHAACVVTYSSAAELSATSHQLGVPVAVKQGVKYCYEIPAPAAAQNRSQHCQVRRGHDISKLASCWVATAVGSVAH